MRLPTSLLAVLAILACSSAPAEGQPEERPRAVVVANVDPALLAPRIALPAPIVFAQTLGIPKVITWRSTAGASGIAWGTTSAIAAGNAYITFNGTNMLLNVPTGDGFSFLVNNVEVGNIATTGELKTNVIQILSGTTLIIEDSAGNDLGTFTDNGTTGLLSITGTQFSGTGATQFNASATTVALTIASTVEWICSTTNCGADTNYVYALGYKGNGGNGDIVFYDSGLNVLATIYDRGTTGAFGLPFAMSDGTNTNLTCSDNGTGVTCNQPQNGTLNLGRTDVSSQVNLGAYPVVFALGNGLDSASLLLPQASGGFYFDEVTDGRVFYVYHNGTGAQWQFDNSSGADYVGYTADAATGFVFNSLATSGTFEFTFGSVANSGFKITDVGVSIANILATGSGTLGGVILTSATVPAGTLAYVDYDGTDMIFNVPTGKGWQFHVNGVEEANLSAGGIFTADAAFISSGFYLTDGNTGLVESGTNDLDIIADNAVIATFSATGVALTGAINFTSTGTVGLGGTVNGVETDYVTADTLATDTTPVSVTGISLAIDASDVYSIVCQGRVFTALAGSGPQMGLDLPASATQNAVCAQTTAATTYGTNSFTADDGSCANTVGGLTTPGGYFSLQSTVTNSTNAGNVVLRIRSEDTNDVTIAAGTVCTAKKVVDN